MTLRLTISAILVVICMQELVAAPWFGSKKTDDSKGTSKPVAPQTPAHQAATKVRPIRPESKPNAEPRHWWSSNNPKKLTKPHPAGPVKQARAVTNADDLPPLPTITYSDPAIDPQMLRAQARSLADSPRGVEQAAYVREEGTTPASRRPRSAVGNASTESKLGPIRVASYEQAAELPDQTTRVWNSVQQAQGLTLPIDEREPVPEIKLSPSEIDDEAISLTVRDAPLAILLSMIAEQHGLNLVAGGDIVGNVTVTLKDVKLTEVFNALLTVNGYSWHRNGNILIISRIGNDNKMSPAFRGLVMRVFKLNYVAGDDIERVVMTLLSPVGRSVMTVTDAKNDRRTREEVVVHDLPEYVDRIEAYIREVDMPPREVLIEAHILQITLSDNTRHGVNLQELFALGNTQVSLSTTGFANPKSSPSFLFGLQNNQLNALLDTLKTTTDSKTLASPKLLCLNGQHARMQVGQSLGYLVTTTTTTSTLQNVSFLNVGVVLNVTPVITNEGHVMMIVKPEVSDGQISAQGLPQTNTTEVETVVMLADGQGMIIGGLIKEDDKEIQNKIPLLGDLWLVGRLFQQRTWLRQRNEIIIALIPHIVPYFDTKCYENEVGVARTLTPLLEGPLIRVDRRQWEPELPDAIRNPLHIFHLVDPFLIDNGVSACP